MGPGRAGPRARRMRRPQPLRPDRDHRRLLHDRSWTDGARPYALGDRADRAADRQHAPATCSTNAARPVPEGVAGRAVHRRRGCRAGLRRAAGGDCRTLRRRSVRGGGRRRMYATGDLARWLRRTERSSFSAARTSRSRSAGSASSRPRSRRRSDACGRASRTRSSSLRDDGQRGQAAGRLRRRARTASVGGAARAVAEWVRSSWFLRRSSCSTRCRGRRAGRSTGSRCLRPREHGEATTSSRRGHRWRRR